jgi:hypothetical protein
MSFEERSSPSAGGLQGSRSTSVLSDISLMGSHCLTFLREQEEASQIRLDGPNKKGSGQGG